MSGSARTWTTSTPWSPASGESRGIAPQLRRGASREAAGQGQRALKGCNSKRLYLCPSHARAPLRAACAARRAPWCAANVRSRRAVHRSAPCAAAAGLRRADAPRSLCAQARSSWPRSPAPTRCAPPAPAALPALRRVPISFFAPCFSRPRALRDRSGGAARSGRTARATRPAARTARGARRWRRPSASRLMPASAPSASSRSTSRASTAKPAPTQKARARRRIARRSPANGDGSAAPGFARGLRPRF